MAVLANDNQFPDINHAREAWKSCMASAFRTAIACVIVGGVTLFGPPSFKQHITLPAFSYVTVILIITDATLGDAFRGCLHALHASLFGICPAIFALWLIGPDRLTATIMAAAVSVSAFTVAVPENAHLIAKRIALGQIVLVYVLAYVNGSKTDPIMHPVHVLASTAVGAVACVLALLLPYPSLASSEVKKNFKLYTKNASLRLKLFLKAFSAEDRDSAHALMSQAKSMARIGTKLLRAIKSKQESVVWERLPINFFKPYCRNPVEKLQHLETPLRGMEIALSSNGGDQPFLLPVNKMLNSEDLKNEMSRTEEYIACQIKSMHLVSTITMHAAENIIDHQLLGSLQSNIPMEQKELAPFFFLFCLKLLQKKTMAAPASPPSLLSSSGTKMAGSSVDSSQKQEEWFFKRIWRSFSSYMKNKKLVPAFKCSVSLGLAVFLGSIYSKENAIWAGLPVAISLAPAKEATFRVANLKAQGTVLGSIYGVFGCFLFQKYAVIRLLSLLPWFFFCSFLRHSRMYGQAGGISAVIGALLILGRKNFGPPSEFAISRITETFIGLSCSIAVEILLQPTRASALAKLELSKNLQAIWDSAGRISLSTSSKANLEDSIKTLKAQVNELGKFIGEAEMEPNFWFSPFPSACYGKLLGSLSKMVELITFTTCAIETFHQAAGEPVKTDTNFWKENVDRLNLDINVFKHLSCSSIKSCEEVSLIRSLRALDKEIERKNIQTDLEQGNKPKIPFPGPNDDSKLEKNLSSYLQDCQELLDGIKLAENDNKDGEKEMKYQMVLSLSSLGFCMNGLIRETSEIEKGIKELIQWENPSRHVDLHEISSKIRALAAAAALETSTN